ncbi:hypothetical protein B7494_g708 [Chlorociboria aeruginascens]|nr:hypothetical protein B7494_g708 [Chlorociboria aeruginascens]
MSLNILKVGALALGYVGTARATQSYQLSTADTYAGEDFFDLWNFFTGPDPTSGFVEYQSQAAAASTTFGSELIKTYDNGSVYIGVDYTNKIVNADGNGRASVRIESKASYTHGLFIADIAHMPDSTCGTWPAFWTYSNVDYPAQGEIDILENINELTDNLYTLHTTDGCTLAGNAAGVTEQTAEQVSYNCADTAVTGPYEAFQYLNQGCSATSTVANSYGTPFNANGGGIYAMEWTSDYIKIWNFGPHNTPSDITNGKPDPIGWGTPSFSTAGGVCDIDSKFKEHSMFFHDKFNYFFHFKFFHFKFFHFKFFHFKFFHFKFFHFKFFHFKFFYFKFFYFKFFHDKFNYFYSCCLNQFQHYVYSLHNIDFFCHLDRTTSTSASGGVTTTSSTPVGTGSATSSGLADSGTTTFTTSVVTSTHTLTITSCAATVLNCPASEATTYVTTYVDIYTTVCPVTATEGSGKATTTSKAVVSGVASSSKTATSEGVNSSPRNSALTSSSTPISSAATGGVGASNSASASLSSGTTIIHSTTTIRKTTTLFTTSASQPEVISSAKAATSSNAAVSSVIYTTAKSNSTIAVGSGGAKTSGISTAAATSGLATTVPVQASGAQSLSVEGLFMMGFALVTCAMHKTHIIDRWTGFGGVDLHFYAYAQDVVHENEPSIKIRCTHIFKPMYINLKSERSLKEELERKSAMHDKLGEKGKEDDNVEEHSNHLNIFPILLPTRDYKRNNPHSLSVNKSHRPRPQIWTKHTSESESEWQPEPEPRITTIPLCKTNT